MLQCEEPHVLAVIREEVAGCSRDVLKDGNQAFIAVLVNTACETLA